MDALSPRLQYLLKVYSDQTATSAEREELMELIDQDLELLQDMGWKAEQRITDERSAQILSSIIHSEGKDVPAPVVSMWRKWRWRAAAAVIIAAVCFSGARFLSGHAAKEVIKVAAAGTKKDVAPGSNKAILTLSNGARITLDSAQVGRLAQQGNVDIVKLDSGRLAYSTANVSTGEILYNSLTTPRGGQYQLTLPDGTRAWLDAESSIRYPTRFAGVERKVQMTGQVYFEVAKNERMPFIVEAAGTKTTVLGTNFNINAYPNEKMIKATLLEGSVKFSFGGQEKLLHPGEQAVVNNGGGLLQVRKTDTYQAVAWKNGLFDFDDMDLPSMMRQISRWYDVTVVFQSNDDSAKFGGGISRQLNLSDVLRLLDKSGIHTRLEDQQLMVLP